MTKEQKIIRAKVGLLELAKQLGNVSQACKMMGYSRDSFYRFKELYDAGGELALQELTRRKPILKNRTPLEVEAIIVELSLDQPAYGQIRIANELRKLGHSINQAIPQHEQTRRLQMDPPAEKDVRNAIERVTVSTTQIEIHLSETVVAEGQDRLLTLSWTRTPSRRRCEIIQRVGEAQQATPLLTPGAGPGLPGPWRAIRPSATARPRDRPLSVIGAARIDQAFQPVRVEPHHPVANGLSRHAADLCCLRACGPIENRRHRQKPPCLRPVHQSLGDGPHRLRVKSVRSPITDLRRPPALRTFGMTSLHPFITIIRAELFDFSTVRPTSTNVSESSGLRQPSEFSHGLLDVCTTRKLPLRDLLRGGNRE